MHRESPDEGVRRSVFYIFLYCFCDALLLLQWNIEVEQLLALGVADAGDQHVRADERLRYSTYVEEEKTGLGGMGFYRLRLEDQIVNLFVGAFWQALGRFF